MAKQSELAQKKDLARILYLSGETAKACAEKVGTTQSTMGRWIEKGGWKSRKAANNITRPMLVNKLLRGINNMLDAVNESDNPDDIAGIGDKLSKFAAVIEKLDKKASVVDTIEVFLAFSKWIQYRATIDSELTPEIIKVINKYQDNYISEQLMQQ